MLTWIAFSALMWGFLFAFSLLIKGEGHAEVLKEFAKRHSMFQQGYFQSNEEAFTRLVKEGQFPPILFIGCSDSRFVPEVITYSRPGDLFVVRTAGNFVPKYDKSIPWDGVGASIQFAVESLNIPDIIVCGHSHCGAITGLYHTEAISKQESGETLVNWLRFGQPAREEVLAIAPKGASQNELYTMTEKSSVLFQIENLMTYPFIQKAVEEGRVRLHAWYYTIETGDVEVYVPAEGRFVNLALFNPGKKSAAPSK